MFTGFKDKLLNVTKNVALFVHDESSLKTKEKPKFNEFAGAEILGHFQNQWEEIHNLNEENARAAENVAVEIENIAQRVNRSKENIDLISHIITNSNLTSNITQCLNQVKEIYDMSESLEQKLIDLENLIEDAELEKMKKQHRFHLNNYKIRKQEALEHLKTTMEEEYKRKARELEDSKKNILEERQKVFQEAFKSDLEIYKSIGTLPKVELPQRQSGAILEEIQLDYDQSELEKFFSEDNS